LFGVLVIAVLGAIQEAEVKRKLRKNIKKAILLFFSIYNKYRSKVFFLKLETRRIFKICYSSLFISFC